MTPPLDTSPRVIAEWAVNLYKDRAAYERLAWLAREAYETRLNWTAFCSHAVQVALEAIALEQPTADFCSRELVETNAHDGIGAR
jgi:hypothetical protein